MESDLSIWFHEPQAQNLISALLPTYFCEFAKGIVPLDLDLRTRTNIFVTYHPNVRESARVRAVLDWVRDLFEPDRWPWFRDTFHPPEANPGVSRPQRKGVAPYASEELV